MLATALSALLLATSALAAPTPDVSNHATVTAYSLNVRAEPGGQIVDNLFQGDGVQVLGERDNWFLVSSETKRGWVHGRYLEFSAPYNPRERLLEEPATTHSVASSAFAPDAQFIVIDTQALRVRDLPSTESDILSVAHRGDIVQVLDQHGKWFYVQFAHTFGWVHGDYTAASGAPTIVNDESVAASMVSVDYEIDCLDDDPYNGYLYRGDCIPGVITNESWLFRYPSVSSGRVVYYAAGVMEDVAANRSMSAPNGYRGMIALMSCSEVGRSVWLNTAGVVSGPYLVTDCTRDYGMFRNLGYYEVSVEVGWEVYQDLESRGLWNGLAVVCFSSACPASGVWLQSYWLNLVEFQ